MQDDGLSTEFLMVGLPDVVRRLEEKGLFKEAVGAINQFLSEGRMLPMVLRCRLEMGAGEN